MDPALDLNINTEIETPRQEPPKACTRTSRCAQQDCSICRTPITHVRNLDDAINNSDERPPTSPTSTTVNLLHPPSTTLSDTSPQRSNPPSRGTTRET